MENPKIDGIELKIGDVIKYEPYIPGWYSGITSKGVHLKGWSPCGKYLYIGWSGVVPISECSIGTEEEMMPINKLYKKAEENQWEEAEKLGLVKSLLHQQSIFASD